MGCRASDHGLDYVPYREASKEVVNAIYQKVMADEACTAEEAEKYQTYILSHLGKQYHRLNVAMQIHYNLSLIHISWGQRSSSCHTLQLDCKMSKFMICCHCCNAARRCFS